MRINNTIKINRNQLLPTFDYPITIINKLKSVNSTTKLDSYYKTVIQNCVFTTEIVRNVQGTQASVGNVYISRIPKDERYKPYAEWIKTLDGFTISTDDYIIKGEIEEDLITPNNIIQIVNKYRPNAFQIRVFKDNTGTIELAEHYKVEGV